MTAIDLLEFLAAALTKQNGGSRRRWRLVIGSITLRDARTHPHCNWSVAPSGSEAEVAAVEALLDRVRLDLPIVTLA